MSPELILGQGLGDLFVVRLAGNTFTRTGLESVDYAANHLGANLIDAEPRRHDGFVRLSNPCSPRQNV